MVFDISSLIPAFAFLLYIAFAAFGFRYHSQDRTRRPFLLYMTAMAIWSLGSFMMHANTGVLTPLAWNRFMMAGLLAVPITIFHALIELVKGTHKRHRVQLYLGYLIYLFLLVFNFAGYIVADAGFEGGEFYYRLGRGAPVAYVLSYFYLILGIAIVRREIRRDRRPITRKKLTPPIYGAVAILLGVLANLYEPLGRYPIDLFAATINAVLIFYSIYRYRLISYSADVLQGILYFVLIVFAATVFSGLMWLLADTYRHLPFEVLFFPSLVLASAAAFIFQPLRRGAMRVIERLYFGHRFDYYRQLRSFSSSLTSIVELERLEDITIEKLVTTFNVEWAFMLIRDYGTRSFRLVSSRGLDCTPEELSSVTVPRNTRLGELITARERVLNNQITPTQIQLTLPGRTVTLSPGLMLPLRFRERINGGVVLGPKKGREYYDQFDVEALEIFADQCSVALENAISFERLRRQQKRLQQMNEELVISNNKLEAFFDGITTPISIQDINYNIVLANIAAARYAGKPSKSMVGEKCYKVFFDRDRPCPGCMAQDCLHTQLPFGSEQREERTDTTFSISFYPVAVPEGSRKLFLEFFQDITTQKQLQEELIQSEKLAGIGTLASGIAHEINNPLGGIIGTAELLLEEADGNEKLKEYTEDIIRYSQDASDIINDLTNYSRKTDEEPGSCDLPEAIRTALKMARRGLDFSNVTIEEELDGDLPDLSTNPNELRQVFLNLIVNAVQAMEGHGTLTLRATHDGETAVVQIVDTGEGIEEEHLDRIFNPFFTTKDPGKGTGLGLSIVHQIIYRMGGRVTVESTRDKGTTFIVYLPITTQAQQRIRFVDVTSERDLEDVFFLQRKILVGEKGYREETIRRPEDEDAFHVIAYKGLQPVGTVSCVAHGMVDHIPIEAHVSEEYRPPKGVVAAEIDRLAVVPEERGGMVPLGLMTIAYLYCKAREAKRVYLDVFSDEKTQVHMYRKLGFQPIGQYEDPLPVVVMMVDHRTDYERNSARLNRFVKPLMSRISRRLEFTERNRREVMKGVEEILSYQPDDEKTPT